MGNDPDEAGAVQDRTADPSPAKPVTKDGAEGGNTGGGGRGAESTVTGTITLAYPAAEKVTFTVPAVTPVTVKTASPPEALNVEVTVATLVSAETAVTTVSSGNGRAVLEIVTVPVAPATTEDGFGDASRAGGAQVMTT